PRSRRCSAPRREGARRSSAPTTAPSRAQSPTARSRSPRSGRPSLLSRLFVVGLVPAAGVAVTGHASALALRQAALALLPGAAARCLLGFAFGFVLDLWNWYAFFPHTWSSCLAREGTGLPFDTAHAAGNLVLALAAGPELRRMLERYGRRLRTEVVWA